ncbi:MAG: ABC transporter ATP-binding protein [Candidatus Limnocylindrales bacterium]
MNELLRVEHLTKLFPLDRRSAIYAVNDVSFSIGRGETLGLVGESGSGKTTVGRCILRLIEPDSGKIVFDGQEITALGDETLRSMRHRMSLVFQDPYTSLNPMRTVQQTAEEPLLIEGQLGSEAREERTLETLEAVRLGRRYLSRYPGELTASEQQRLAIARALVTHPALVVVDEATSTLDARARAAILDVLIGLQRDLGVSYLYISHDLTAVERISHRVAIMYLGRIVEVASTEVIFSKQLHPYSRALLSAVLFPDPARKLEPFHLAGEIPSAINPPAECPLVGRCPFVLPECRTAVPPLVELEPAHLTACIRSGEFVAGGVPASQEEARQEPPARPGHISQPNDQDVRQPWPLGGPGPMVDA